MLISTSNRITDSHIREAKIRNFILQLAIIAVITVIPVLGFGQEVVAGDTIPSFTDFVRIKNGDRLIGEINKIQRNELYFKGDKTGEVKIKLKEIDYLLGSKKIYELHVPGYGTIAGKIAATQTGMIVVYNASDSITFKIEDILTLKAFKVSLADRINGHVDFGYSYSKSSEVSRFNLSDEFSYLSRRWEIQQGFSSIYTTGDGDGLERLMANIETTRQLGKKWILTNDFQYQKMLELGVKSRFINIISIGKMLIQSRHVELDVGTGVSEQKEYATDGSISKIQTEIPLVVNFRLFQLTDPNIKISSNGLFYYNTTVDDRFRIDYKFDLGYNVMNFTIGIQFYYNHDSRPLTEEASAKTDYGSLITLGYRF